MSIKMIRIDDRLIHGQIVTAWAKNLQIKKIWIADDGVAKDDFIKGVMQMVAPSDRELIITPTSDIPALVDKLDGEADNVLILMSQKRSFRQVSSCRSSTSAVWAPEQTARSCSRTSLPARRKRIRSRAFRTWASTFIFR